MQSAGSPDGSYGARHKDTHTQASGPVLSPEGQAGCSVITKGAQSGFANVKLRETSQVMCLDLDLKCAEGCPGHDGYSRKRNCRRTQQWCPGVQALAGHTGSMSGGGGPAVRKEGVGSRGLCRFVLRVVSRPQAGSSGGQFGEECMARMSLLGDKLSVKYLGKHLEGNIG